MRAARLLAGPRLRSLIKQYVEAEEDDYANPPESGIAGSSSMPVARLRRRVPPNLCAARVCAAARLPPSGSPSWQGRAFGQRGFDCGRRGGRLHHPARPEPDVAKRSCARHIEARNVMCMAAWTAISMPPSGLSCARALPHRRHCTARISNRRWSVSRADRYSEAGAAQRSRPAASFGHHARSPHRFPRRDRC